MNYEFTEAELKEAYEFDSRMAERIKDLREGKISQEEYDKQALEFLEEDLSEETLEKLYNM